MIQNMGIDPKLLSLTRLFDGRLFKIPNYQRAYSWKKEHRKALFGDIKSSFEKKREHFMATVVGLKQDNPIIIAAKEYQNVDIVDGQQRITTLIILCKAISMELGQAANEKKVKQDLDETLVKHDERVLLLQTNHDTSHYFSNYIRLGTYDPPKQAKTSADRNLLEAMIDCEEFVKKWKNEQADLVELIAHINNKINFVYHEIDEEQLVYSVFEILNSRGLSVSWFDRLKSTLMGMAFDQKCTTDMINEIHKRWSEIYRKLGVLQLAEEVLRFAATLYEHDKSRMLSDTKSVELLADRSKGGPRQIIQTLVWIEKVAKSVIKIHEDKREVSLNNIVHARLVAVAIDLRDDLTVDEKDELYGCCSRAAFCIYGICGKDARNAVGEHVRLAYDINRKKISVQQIKDRLLDVVSKYPVNESIKKLAKTDCYTKWQNELRYLLYKYEEHLAEKSGQNITNEQWNRIWEGSASKTIEHILPQSTKRAFVHYLGNLFLLPPEINSKLSDISPIKKDEEYAKTGFLMLQDIRKSLPKWSRQSVIERGEKIAQWAAKEWGIPQRRKAVQIHREKRSEKAAI